MTQLLLSLMLRTVLAACTCCDVPRAVYKGRITAENPSL